MENSFSLLGDVEVDDVSTFLERLATEAKAKEKQQKRNSQSVRTEGGRGPGGQGRGSWRTCRNVDQQFEIVDNNGYQRDNRGFHGYQQNNGVNGYSNGTVDGYRKNNGWGNGYQPSYGRRDWVSRGRGRGPFRAHNGHNGVENVSQIVAGNQQVELSQVQGGDTGSAWEKVIGKQHGNGSSSYGDGRRQSGGGRFRGRGGRINGDGYVVHNYGAKEASGSSGNRSINGDNDIGNVAAATEVSKDDVVQEENVEESRIKTKEEEEKEARKKAWLEEQKEEAKKLTLKQYQKQLLEKRKAFDVLKPEERKVTLDKDFESMQLVGKKKEDSLFIKQDTENGKLKKKDDKICKSAIIVEFLKPADAEYRKHGGVGYQRGTLSRQDTYSANEDRFPHPADGKDRFVNSDRNRGGGGGGSARGSSADLAVVSAPSKKHVKPPVPAFDDSLQFPVLGPIVKY